MKKTNVFDLEDLKISVRYGDLRADTFARYCEAITSYNAKFIAGNLEDLQAAQEAWDLINYYQQETLQALNLARTRLKNFIFEMDGKRAKKFLAKKSLFDLEQEYLAAEECRRKNSELKNSLFLDLVIKMIFVLAQSNPVDIELGTYLKLHNFKAF